MKKIIIIIVLSLVVSFAIAQVINGIKRTQLSNSKLSELKEIADKTSQLTKLEPNLERIEDDTGFYKIKGGEHYRWSIRDAYKLSNISRERIEDIDRIMVVQGWKRQDSIKPTLAGDYSWAKQYHNSFDLRYSKKTNTNIVCQRFSFWWDSATTENNKIANTFIYTEFTDFCRE